MHRFRAAALAVTAGAATLVAPAVAAAKVHRPVIVSYKFNGTLIGEPGPNATHVSIQLRGGNLPALRSVIGFNTRKPLTFTLGAHTAFYIASGRKWVLGTSANLHDTDPVTVVVRARKGLKWRALSHKPARSVWDRAAIEPAHGVLYFFWGAVTGVDVSSHRVSITVLDGNHRALRLMLGVLQQQSFTYDASTVFVHWAHGIPVLVSPATITAGQRLSIRIRAKAGLGLAAVESTPARIIGVRDAPPADS
jgi:hypothetical protein